MIPQELLRTREASPAVKGCVAVLLLAALATAMATGASALQSSLALACLVAVAGWLPQRRWRDALLLGLPVLLSDQVEWTVAPQVLSVLVLVLFLATLRPLFSAVLGCALLALLLIASELKLHFAGTSLTLQDVKFFFAQFHDNVGVMASQPLLLVSMPPQSSASSRLWGWRAGTSTVVGELACCWRAACRCSPCRC